jgi:segregation and condensation protein A
MEAPAGSDAVLDEVLVGGRPLEKLPEDLYIPPDALRVILEAFAGPLDLLLYLIRRQNLDILDIPVHRIAEQYLGYIDLMRELEIDLAGEYLLMAAMLAEIKSRMLLPRPTAEEDEGGDPRAELVRRLQEYERFKTAGEALDALPRVGRDVVPVQLPPMRIDVDVPQPVPELVELLAAFRDLMHRAELFAHHQVQREPLSVRERMSGILQKLRGGRRVVFTELFEPAEGRMGVVVSFIAILELVREALVELRQEAPFAPLEVAAAGARGDRAGPHDVIEAKVVRIEDASDE